MERTEGGLWVVWGAQRQDRSKSDRVVVYTISTVGRAMLRPTPELSEFERRYARHRNAHATYDEALAVFKALWTEACTLRPDFPEVDWRRDLEPDLAIARAVNGLPPA